MEPLRNFNWINISYEVSNRKIWSRKNGGAIFDVDHILAVVDGGGLAGGIAPTLHAPEIPLEI